MRKYRVTNAAEEDLIQIADFGDENFGEAQSDIYRDQLEQRFFRIGEKPFLYPPVDYIFDGYRRSVCGAHSIYYKLEGDVAAIVRVLGRQDPRKALEEYEQEIQ